MKRLRQTVKNHLDRTAVFDWAKRLRDPRHRRGRRWSFAELMTALWRGALCATKNLRQVESLTERLGERVPDTTLRSLLVRLGSKPVARLLRDEVRAAVRAKEIAHTLPFSLCAIDGKAIRSASTPATKFCQEQNQEHHTSYVLRALRAAIVSGPCKLQIGQMLIQKRAGEITTVPRFIDDLHASYSRSALLEVFSLDAGFCGRAVADHIVAKGYSYILALKNPQKELVLEAERLLGGRRKPDAESPWERVGGRWIRRLLYRSTDIAGYHGWKHLREVWRVRQETRRGEVIESIEERYFVTNLSPQRTAGLVPLHAVRAHWGIENDANRTMDMEWLEDDAHWAGAASEVVALLRLIAFNVHMRLRARRLRSAGNKTRTWQNLRDIVFDVFLLSALAPSAFDVEPVSL